MTRTRELLKSWAVAWRSLPSGPRRWLFRVGALLLALDVACLVLSQGPFLTWFAYRFRAQDALHQSDAMVVLIGGSDRAAWAAELYRQGISSVILMGQKRSTPYDETAEHRQILLQKGVPNDAIAILPGEPIKNTYDEAIRVREYVRIHPVHSITVVTTAYHTARAGWILGRVLHGSGVVIRMSPSQDPRFTEADWYTQDDGIDLYLREALKTVYYHLMY